MLFEISFPEAIQCVIDGKQVTRVEWNDNNTYVSLHSFADNQDQFLAIHNSNNRHNPGWHQFLVRDADMLQDDWVVIKAKPDASH